MLLNNKKIKSLIDKLWNTFWSGGISNPLTAIEQITYLLFMKRLDQLETKREEDHETESSELRFKGKFKIPGSEEKIDKSKLRWSAFSNMPTEEMLPHIQNKVFPFLKQMNGGESPFTKHMKNAVFIIPKPLLLGKAVEIIEDIFKEIEKDAEQGKHAFQDIQGDVYEMLLSEIATSGKNGQFRTPRHIIKLIVELVDPKYGDKIADPACGTAGFLLGSYHHIITQAVKEETPEKLEVDDDGFERGSTKNLSKERNTVLSESLVGFDIDPTMVRLGLMNLMMHGIDTPQLDYNDTLSQNYNEASEYDVVMANPPFTGSIDKEIINDNLSLNTKKTELLFIEQIYNMLKPGGTAGMIVPRGVLFGRGKNFIDTRRILVEESELKAVISMPSGVFKPYAGVSTAILIFEKGGKTKDVFFYKMKNDGYSLDDKRRALIQENGERDYGDLQQIIASFSNRDTSANDRNEKYFLVPKDEIIERNYDLSFKTYSKETIEEVSYDSPEVIFKRIIEQEDLIEKELKNIKSIIDEV